MSSINGNMYFGNASIIFDESENMVITQDPGDFRIL